MNCHYSFTKYKILWRKYISVIDLCRFKIIDVSYRVFRIERFTLVSFNTYKTQKMPNAQEKFTSKSMGMITNQIQQNFYLNAEVEYKACNSKLFTLYVCEAIVIYRMFCCIL